MSATTKVPKWAEAMPALVKAIRHPANDCHKGNGSLDQRISEAIRVYGDGSLENWNSAEIRERYLICIIEGKILIGS